MKHVKKQCHGQVVFEWERDEESDPIEIVVCYTLNPYVPATWEQPAEGGDCEMWDFQLYHKHGLQFPESGSILSQFKDALETNEALREAVEDYCRDDATSRCEQY